MARIAARPCPVTAQSSLGGGYRLTEFEAPDLAAAVQPGQFVMVRIPGVGDPLLGRPFSVFGVARDRSGAPVRVTLLYHVVGRGTAMLATVPVGAPAVVLGPLGRGFAIERDPARALLVAGGIGIAGLHLLAGTLAGRGTPTTLLYGARSAADLVTADRFAAAGATVKLATDDGSAGTKGFVTALLDEELAARGPSRPTLYACGPSPMLRRVREVALAGDLDCELALEARMGCGFGVCLGCVVPSASVPGTFKLVCRDGPCLPAREVIP